MASLGGEATHWSCRWPAVPQLPRQLLMQGARHQPLGRRLDVGALTRWNASLGRDGCCVAAALVPTCSHHKPCAMHPRTPGISSVTNLIKSYQQRTGKPKELGESCALPVTMKQRSVAPANQAPPALLLLLWLAGFLSSQPFAWSTWPGIVAWQEAAAYCLESHSSADNKQCRHRCSHAGYTRE